MLLAVQCGATGVVLAKLQIEHPLDRLRGLLTGVCSCICGETFPWLFWFRGFEPSAALYEVVWRTLHLCGHWYIWDIGRWVQERIMGWERMEHVPLIVLEQFHVMVFMNFALFVPIDWCSGAKLSTRGLEKQRSLLSNVHSGETVRVLSPDILPIRLWQTIEYGKWLHGYHKSSYNSRNGWCNRRSGI